MNIRLLATALAVFLGLSISSRASAEVIADWGTVVTPLSSEATFSFAQYDITANFTDQYAFSLEGDTGATYEVTFSFDTCTNGCGNPDLSYGIYDANGGLVADASGTVTLSAGNYVFQVKGTGMGSGSNLDYWGSVSFSAATVSTAMVSPVPEPSTWLSLLPGLVLVRWAVRRRRHRKSPEPTLVRASPAFAQGC